MQCLTQLTSVSLVAGSIVGSTKCRYLSYLEGDFEFFVPHGRHVALMGGEFWHGGVDTAPPIGAKIREYGPKN